VEWPGGTATHTTLKVTDSVFDAVSRTLKNVPFEEGKQPRPDQICLPWGSIVDIKSGGKSLPILTGPAEFHGKWSLPIYELGELGTGKRRPKLDSDKFRRKRGLQPIENSLPAKTINAVPKVLTIRQPWAHAIVHMGKDVENRSWRANYKGPLLIHASAYQEKDPRGRLEDAMGRPLSKKLPEPLPTGSIVGVAELFDYVKDAPGRWAQKGFWHWRLRKVRPIKPVPCTGRLGLWTPPKAILRKLPKWVQAL
jgi:hypothetical protein